MTLTPLQIQIMKEDLYSDLIVMMMERFSYSQEEAINVLYNSDTFDRIADSETGLYYQSPGYVWSFLQSEIVTGDYRS